jgi:hypothetical protein
MTPEDFLEKWCPIKALVDRIYETTMIDPKGEMRKDLLALLDSECQKRYFQPKPGVDCPCD